MTIRNESIYQNTEITEKYSVFSIANDENRLHPET